MATNKVSPLAIVVFAATIIVLFVNYFAVGMLDASATNSIAAKYPTPVSPAGYSASILTIIYLLSLVFAIYQLIPANAAKFTGIRITYILTCILNCLWVVAWYRSMFLFSAFLIVALLGTLVAMLSSVKNAGTAMESLLGKGTLGLYAGWVTVMTLVNILVVVRSQEVSMTDGAFQTLGVICLLIAGASAVLARWKLNNYLFPLAIAWIAAAVGIRQSGETALVVASAVTMIVGLVTAATVVLSLPTRTYT
ncbi:MAG TPA: hypothetical protein PLR83_08570 [Pyrinomonadaceae bacterium]|nr:hypothetical protein [Pyrinomonadaceae bacterium]